jgi:uncharacterized protein YllA (UPF0747 family)
MENTPIRHSRIPGASKLFTGALYDFARVARFYSYDPGRHESFVEAARRVEYPDARRASLVEALREANGHSPALDALSRSGTVAVVTGQQVGLFSGPAYTVYKALTAIKLARQLSESGVPAVPLFWLATEDHDFEEVRHVWVFDAAHNPVRLSVPADTSERPVGGIPLPAWPVSGLRDALAGLPFAEDVVRDVEAACAPGATLGGSFLALLKRLFARFGLLFVDPLQPALRDIAAPFLGAAAEAAPELVRRLLERNRELSDAGYHAQVHVEPASSLLFSLENGRRIPLLLGQRVPEPRHLSPNALLRPVMQDYLLPTVAYVGGPAEVAYFAQAQVLYQALGVRPPVVVPRAGFTLLDSRAVRLMSRYGLEFLDLLREDAALKDHITSRLVPPGLTALFGQTGEAFRSRLDELRREVLAFDPTLAAALDKARAKMLYQLSKTEGKVKRETLRRDERAAGDAAHLANLVYPHRHLQERFYSFLPFLAKHGPDLLDRVYESLRLDTPDHLVLAV